LKERMVIGHLLVFVQVAMIGDIIPSCAFQAANYVHPFRAGRGGTGMAGLQIKRVWRYWDTAPLPKHISEDAVGLRQSSE